MILPVEQFLTLFCLHGSPDPTFENRAKMNGSTLFMCQVDSRLGRWGVKQVSMKRRISSRKKQKVALILLALSLPISVLAQRGLFQRGGELESLRSGNAATLTNHGFGNPINGSNLTNNAFGNQVGGNDLTNQTFGAPIGSGVFIMLLAGVGYTVLKTNKKNNKN